MNTIEDSLNEIERKAKLADEAYECFLHSDIIKLAEKIRLELKYSSQAAVAIEYKRNFFQRLLRLKKRKPVIGLTIDDFSISGGKIISVTEFTDRESRGKYSLLIQMLDDFDNLIK